MNLSYTELDESKDEIRLLTLLPAVNSGIVHCKLEAWSLTALRPEFEGFKSSAESKFSSKRKVIADWARSQYSFRLGQSTPIEGQNYIHHHTPAASCYRFDWGDYAALSYVWGNERNTRKIIVNGQEIQVTRNLEHALRAFRERSEFGSDFKLWVDAISINQGDKEERGRQVRRMRDIYGNAWTVIAWVGEESHESDKAIQLVKCLSEFSRTGSGDQLEAKLWGEPEHLGRGCWLALKVFMERPYWHRLWIIQEIVMGASSILIRCGTSSIDWTSFCAGVGLLQEHLWLVKDELLRQDAARLTHQIDSIWTTTSLHLVYRYLSVLSQSDESGQYRLSFGGILDIANSAECLDPRDKVYGLVGMMESQIAKQLIPDYTLAPSAVYAEVCKAYIQSYRNLEPLREGNPWGPTKTPSWVADWQWQGRLPSPALARIENPLWGPFWLTGKTVPNASDHIPYNASGQSQHEVSFPNELLLNCTGFIVDSISGLSSRGRGYFAWSKNSIIQAKQWKSVYGGVGETSNALYRALVADRVGRGQKASERHSVILNLPSNFYAAEPQFQKLGWTWLCAQESYYFRWEEWRHANRGFKLGDYHLNEFFSDEIPLNASEYDFTEVYCCFDRTCQKRRFMLTSNGYLGWAPDNIFGSPRDQTMKGDLIAILFGCSTPIVIRPHGEHFKVVGEAYVQGLMEGEGMKFLESGRFHARSFTFC